MKAYTFNPPYGQLLQVDIVIEESLAFQKFYRSKISKKFNGISAPVISISDLIVMKKRAHRDKDVLDLQVLKYLSGQ